MTKKEFIKKCIEIRICRNMIILFIIIDLIVSGIFILPFLAQQDIEMWSLVILFTIIFVVIIMYYLYRYFSIISNFKNYDFLDVKFTEMHSGFRNLSYFSLHFEHYGKNCSVDTKIIFSSSIMEFIYPRYDDYLNKNVLIAYNHESNVVVVIKPVKDSI